jgi:23S rRNA (guanosine2251-2'-O)-methyltransferase
MANKKPSDRPRHSSKPNIWGTHAVIAAWKNPDRRIKKLFLTEKSLRSFENLLSLRKEVTPAIVSKEELNALLPKGSVHQGAAALASPLPETFIQDIIIKSRNKDSSLILMLDQVTDPHNVGAIMRSACAFGADGIIMQKKHSPSLSGVLAKTATGAVDITPVAFEINLSKALRELSEAGYMIIGLDEHASQTLGALTLPDKLVLVLGSEDKGIRPKVLDHCDEAVKLPTSGAIESLNVSNAAAIALYEASKA